MGSGIYRRGPGAPPRPEQQEPPQALFLPWEGPYVVVEVLRPGTYKLKIVDGEVFVNAWSIEQLHRFYP